MHLPETLVEQYHAFTSGDAEPAVPRDAATVILLRDGASSPEAYLLRRQTSMAFAAGMYVYPGGGVDPRDVDAEVSWVGPSREEWSERLGVEARQAAALVCAAVRETFEESGVLLAGPNADEVVADTTGEDWEADRSALEGKELAFTDFLARRGLVLRTDLLGAWTAWTTPVFEPRRYRTWFFVASLPEGQRTRDVSTESDEVVWLPVADALAQADAREIAMMPPTYLNALEVVQLASVADVLADAAGRRVAMFTPELTDEGEGPVLSVPPEVRPLLEALDG
ncbi:hypothetical protein GCM10011519_24160 [Marmoricola endophyticus]|uniref:Nudix hydrolase domain-containing protein n=1 Tax=Marmoricola endophyticus TaxID=2040280 RepID=A0A917BLS5_9ACTN|nr:hypothetical protein GCM10011519_24160 [Marmoricola endophyticus]